jgi:hypothetical protein
MTRLHAAAASHAVGPLRRLPGIPKHDFGKCACAIKTDGEVAHFCLAAFTRWAGDVGAREQVEPLVRALVNHVAAPGIPLVAP